MFGLILYMASKRDAFADLAPNELGDFAAGAFAPLAFLWLVLGFFQQGEELRHSGRALWLQGQELQNSVEQQRELVKATRDQLEFESARLSAQEAEVDRNAQPVLEMRGGGHGPGDREGFRRYKFNLFNHGRPCTDLKIGNNDSPYRSQPVLPTGEWAHFELNLQADSVMTIDVPVSYRDERLLAKRQMFQIVKEGPSFSFLIKSSDSI